MFGYFDIDSMNETDVREILVRPLLTSLGYKQGTEANIRTEMSFRYGKAFLGRKNPDKDPDLKELRGRADYICDVVSYGRWIVEVKHPSEKLNIDTAQQAHTYAAHPEVAAIFYLVTNGRVFRLYRVSYPDAPLIEWRTEETASLFDAIFNILSPDSIKKLVFVPVDLGKPLARNYPSKLEIIGGQVTYGKHTSSHPLFQAGSSQIEGANASIIGVDVQRDETSKITATLNVAGPYSFWDDINKLAGWENYHFITSDEVISINPEKPTIFQNLEKVEVPKGTLMTVLPGQPKYPLPFSVQMTAFTEAIGFLNGMNFKGTFEISYEIITGSGREMLRFPPIFTISGEGLFNVRVMTSKRA